MINDLPPRDVPPSTEPRNVTGNDIIRDIHPAGRDEDFAYGDFLGEDFSQLPPPTLQQEYLVNTSGLDPSSSLHSETSVGPSKPSVSQLPLPYSPGLTRKFYDLQGSAFHEPLRPFYDRHVLSPADLSRATSHEGWEEPSYVSIMGLSGALTMSPHFAHRVSHSDDPVSPDDIPSVSHLTKFHRMYTIRWEGRQVPHSHVRVARPLISHPKATYLHLV